MQRCCPGHNSQRFRLTISDGRHYCQALLAQQLNHLVTADKQVSSTKWANQKWGLTRSIFRRNLAREVTCFKFICEWDVVWQVQKFSIIQVQDCICNVVLNHRIVILLNVEVCLPLCVLGLSLLIFSFLFAISRLLLTLNPKPFSSFWFLLPNAAKRIDAVHHWQPQ